MMSKHYVESLHIKKIQGTKGHDLLENLLTREKTLNSLAGKRGVGEKESSNDLNVFGHTIH